MQQYAFINNNTIALIAPLDDTTSHLPYTKIEIEKIDFGKYNQGLDIKLENGKVSFYSGERKQQFDEDAQKLKEEQEKIEWAEKFARVYQKLLALPTINKNTDKAILEGIEFTDKQIGDLIQARVFEGNPHAESAMQAKFSAWIASVVLGKPNNELKAEIDAKQIKINEVREFFGLTPLNF